MPRTKRPTSKKEKVTEDDEAWKKLDRLVTEQKNKIDTRVQQICHHIEFEFMIMLKSMDIKVLNKTVAELKYELHLPSATKTRSASHDDGYLTEGSAQGSGSRGNTMAPPSNRSVSRRSRSADACSRQPPSTARGTNRTPPSSNRSVSRRSRSADASSRQPPSTVRGTARRRSRSVYRTPALNKNMQNNFPAITPKVAPNTPLTVLRQPRQGEMVVSMSGSPVMVPQYNNMQPSERANCNIMLSDGTMLSLQPRQLRASSAYIPFSLMDSDTLRQLRTLKDNLDKVVQCGEQLTR